MLSFLNFKLISNSGQFSAEMLIICKSFYANQTIDGIVILPFALGCDYMCRRTAIIMNSIIECETVGEPQKSECKSLTQVSSSFYKMSVLISCECISHSGRNEHVFQKFIEGIMIHCLQAKIWGQVFWNNRV